MRNVKIFFRTTNIFCEQQLWFLTSEFSDYKELR